MSEQMTHSSASSFLVPEIQVKKWRYKHKNRVRLVWSRLVWSRLLFATAASSSLAASSKQQSERQRQPEAAQHGERELAKIKKEPEFFKIFLVKRF